MYNKHPGGTNQFNENVEGCSPSPFPLKINLHSVISTKMWQQYNDVPMELKMLTS